MKVGRRGERLEHEADGFINSAQDAKHDEIPWGWIGEDVGGGKSREGVQPIRRSGGDIINYPAFSGIFQEKMHVN